MQRGFAWISSAMWWEIRPQSGGRSRAELAADGLAGFLVGASLGAASGVPELEGPETGSPERARELITYDMIYIYMLIHI